MNNLSRAVVLGYAPIIQDPFTGRVGFDRNQLAPANGAMPMYQPPMQVGYQAGGGDDDDMFAGLDDDTLADAVLAGTIDFGAIKNPRRKERVRDRLQRRISRANERGRENIEERLLGRAQRLGLGITDPDDPRREAIVGGTAVMGFNITISAAGAVSGSQSAGEPFDINDIIIEAPTGTTFSSIKLATRELVTSGSVSAAAFGPTGVQRSIAAGHKIAAGQFVSVVGNVTATSGVINLTLTGRDQRRC